METEIVKIKKGLEISSANLEKIGWKNTNKNFGYSQIWKKESERMLYDYKIGIVSLIFSK